MPLPCVRTFPTHLPPIEKVVFGLCLLFLCCFTTASHCFILSGAPEIFDILVKLWRFQVRPA